MFQAGDKIFYPMHGVGTIEDIEEKEILGELHKYYIVKINISNVKIMLPVDNAEQVGIREIISDADADAAIRFFGIHSAESCAGSWNKRYRENIEKLKSNNPFDIAAVVKELLLREKKKPLSTAERKLLSNAKNILISELAAAKNAEYSEIEALLTF